MAEQSPKRQRLHVNGNGHPQPRQASSNVATTSSSSSSSMMVTVRGIDRPGVASRLFGHIAKADCSIVNLEQLVVHDMLTLVLMLNLTGGHIQVLKDLLFAAKELDIQLDFRLLEDGDYLSQALHVVTVLSKDVTPSFLFELSSFLLANGINIAKIRPLTRDSLECVELSVLVPSSTNFLEMKQELVALAKRFACDVAIQKETLLRRKKRLVVFDLDNLVIQEDVLTSLLEYAGKGKEGKEIDEEFQSDRITFAECLTRKVGLLEGEPSTLMDDFLNKFTYTEGVRRLCSALDKLGYKRAVISSGFTFITDRVKKDLSLDFAFGNVLGVRRGRLTGKLDGPLVDIDRKSDLLGLITQEEDIPLNQVVAIGNGGITSTLLSKVGLGIAFDAHPQDLGWKINSTKNILTCLFLLGYDMSDIEDLGFHEREAEQRMTRSNSMCQPNERKLVVTVAGGDKPGILCSIMKSISDKDCRLLDLKQMVMYGSLNVMMVIVVKIEEAEAVMKDVLFAANKLKLDVEFSDAKDDMQVAASDAQDDQFVITAVAPEITVSFLAALTEYIANENISIQCMSRLSENSMSCVELKVPIPSAVDQEHFNKGLLALSGQFDTDIALQADNLVRYNKRLVVFDMDSTLIQQEVIDELAHHCGVKKEVEQITARAMNGELDFNQSLYERVKLLEGADSSIFQHVIDNLVYTDGVQFLCKALKQLGYKLAVISGGFTPMTDHVKKVLGLDYAFANNLEVDSNGKLTGMVVGAVVNAQRKADLLNLIAQREGISREQVVAIGDGANDLIMLSQAGLGIAFNAKPRVQAVAEYRINQKSISTLMYLLGFSDKETQTIV